MHELIPVRRQAWWTISRTGGDIGNHTSMCQHTSQLSQCLTVVLQKHNCYFLALIIYLRAMAASQMPLHIPHLHRHISRYFTHLIRLHLFITVTHLLITPPISNSFYTGTTNHIFQMCYALRFNSISLHTDILKLTLLSVTQLSQVPFYRVKVRCDKSLNVAANMRKQKVALIFHYNIQSANNYISFITFSSN